MIPYVQKTSGYARSIKPTTLGFSRPQSMRMMLGEGERFRADALCCFMSWTIRHVLRYFWLIAASTKSTLRRVAAGVPEVAMTIEPRTRNPKSTASIAGHPIHPMLIPFPIAFFVGTFICDLVFWNSGNPSWFEATLWLLGAGLIMAALAAIAGLTDVLGDVKIRTLSTAWWHAGGNVLAVLIELYNWY